MSEMDGERERQMERNKSKKRDRLMEERDRWNKRERQLRGETEYKDRWKERATVDRVRHVEGEVDGERNKQKEKDGWSEAV